MQKGQKNAQNGKNDTRHSLEVDSQGNELTEAQQVPVLDDFFNALDNAIDNRQRMLDGDTASKADLRDDIRYSKKLGQFADVNVNSEEELKSLGFDAKFPRLKDYIHVQKTVIKALNDRGFFDNNHNIVVNADTDIVVDIGRSGIRETFSTERRYAQLPMDKKRAKLAVLTKLPEMIKFAEVENPGENNRHGGSSKFLVLKHPATIDGKEYSVTLRIKLTPQKNKFYIHDMTLFNQNKNEMNSLIAPEDASAVIYNDNSSRNGSVAESGQNVKTEFESKHENNTRKSLEADSQGKKIDTLLSELTNDVLSMADEKAKQNAAEDTYIRIIKNTPQVILEYVNGSEDLEVIMRFDKYYLAARHDGVLDGHYQNLGTLMSELSRYIEQPDAII